MLEIFAKKFSKESFRDLLFRKPKAGIRADIQFMRAVAVIAVVVYHLWPDRLKGGFLGVDIFFVISGFLMTSHIVNGLGKGGSQRGNRLRFFGHFYVKRIRRLAPAALVSLASVLGIYWILFRHKAYLLSLTAEQVIASALFVQNWMLAHDAVDYLAQNNDVTAVEHFWSLSVEEQFYFIWPLFLMVSFLVGLRRQKTRETLLFFVSGFTALSLLFSVWFTAANPAVAYFITPTRLWELSLGGIIAVLPASRPGFSIANAKGSGLFLQWVGIVLCLASIVLIDSGRIAFPGAWALIPTIGAALVVLGGGNHSEGGERGVFDRAANFRPFQFIGDISYSLYLWHFVCIKTYYFYDLYYGDAVFYPKEKIFIVLPLSFVFATISYYLVEKTSQRARSRPKIAIFAGLSIILVIGAAFAEYHYGIQNGAMAREELGLKIDRAIEAELSGSPASPELCLGAMALDHPAQCGDAYGELNAHLLDDVERDYDLAAAKQCDMYRDSDVGRFCYFGDAKSSRTIILWGDSHAMQFADAIDVAAKALGYKLVVATRSACPPLLFNDDEAREFFAQNEFGLQYMAGCVQRNNFILNSAEYKNAELILLSSSGFFSPRYQMLVDNAVKLNGKNVAIIQDPPSISKFPDDVPPAVGNKWAFMLSKGELSVSADAVKFGGEFFRALDENGVAYRKIDTTDLFCDGGRCYLAIGSLPVFRDSHITGTYSRTIGPWFSVRLRALLSRQ